MVQAKMLLLLILLNVSSANALPLDSCKALLARGNLSGAFTGARSLRDGRQACTIYRQIAEHSNANDTLKRAAINLLLQAYTVEGDTAQYRVWQSKLEKPNVLPISNNTLQDTPIVDDPWNISAVVPLVPFTQPVVIADTAPAPQPMLSGYTLQIGSFSTRENALARITQLDKFFGSVFCSDAIVKDKVFYRVRIGSYVTPEDAQGFARRNLTPRGIGFSIVKQ